MCKRCAFTGYRPQKIPFGFNESDPACEALKAELYRRIVDLIGQGYAHFLSGGAMATDTWAAEAVVELPSSPPAACVFSLIMTPDFLGCKVNSYSIMSLVGRRDF